MNSIETITPPSYLEALKNSSDVLNSQGHVLGTSSAASLSGLFALMHGGDKTAAKQISLAWVLLTDAANVLDDIQDGERDCNVLSTKLDLNASTGLIFAACHVLTSLVHFNISTDTTLEIVEKFQAVGLSTAGGQHLDLINKPCSLSEAWHIVEHKTANAAALACWAGARLGTNVPVELEAAWNFGKHLGYLEQIRDDFCDLWGDASNDVTQRCWNSLPIAYAMSTLDDAPRNELRELLTTLPITSEAEQRARELLIEGGAAIYLYLQSMAQYTKIKELLMTMSLSVVLRNNLLAASQKLLVTIPT